MTVSAGSETVTVVVADQAVDAGAVLPERVADVERELGTALLDAGGAPLNLAGVLRVGRSLGESPDDVLEMLGQAAQGMVAAQIADMANGHFVSEYDAFLARRIAYVISGGDVRTNSAVDEEVILNLEREAFVDFWKQEKTVARVEHMLTTGKPLRN